MSGSPGDRAGYLTGGSGPDPDAIARVLGSSYLLHEVLGQGATGEVWRGTYRPTGQAVAVKILRPGLAADHDLVARFLRERSILTGLRDPHLVGVRDLVAEGETLAIVMDLVEGSDLRRFLAERGTLAPAQAVTLVTHVLSALQAGHDAGVVHRDIKPENILLDLSDPAAPRALLSDFGIARLTEGPSLTNIKGTIGTPEYMAPELAEDGDATPASDLYAVGIVLYELLAGRSPFSGGSPLQVLRRQVDAVPARPPGMPDALWDVIGACLDKRPAARPPSARELARRLGRLAEELAPLGPLAPAPEGSTMLATPRRSSPGSSPGAEAATPGQTVIPGGRPPASRSKGAAARWAARARRARDAPPRVAPPARPPGPGETVIPGGRPAAPRAKGATARWAAAGRRTWVIAGAAAVALVVLVAGAMAVLPGSSPPNVDVTRNFPPVTTNGLIIARAWKVDGGGLRTVLQVTNDTAVPTTQVLDEVIPKSIASSVRKVEFDPPVPETVKDDPVVQYQIENLAPRATVTFTYRVGVGGVTRKQLDLWAADQARAEREHTTLAKLAVVPPQLSMTVRQVRKLDVRGTMQDGTPAPPAALEGVTWTSSGPAAAVVFGTIIGVTPGQALITAKVGGVEAQAPVVVQGQATGAAPPP